MIFEIDEHQPTIESDESFSQFATSCLFAGNGVQQLTAGAATEAYRHRLGGVESMGGPGPQG